jgi:hypothetical protein
VTKLLQDLRDELVRRDYAASTIRSYIQIVEAFRQHSGARLDRLTPAQLRRYHLYLLEERRLAVGTVVTQICALRFFCRYVLKRRDVREDSVRKESGPVTYELARPGQANRLDALEVRIAGDTAAIGRAIREEVRRINPRLLVDIKTRRQEIDRSIATERMVAATSAFFSLLGLLLGSIGIFSKPSPSATRPPHRCEKPKGRRAALIEQ